MPNIYDESDAVGIAGLMARALALLRRQIRPGEPLPVLRSDAGTMALSRAIETGNARAIVRSGWWRSRWTGLLSALEPRLEALARKAGRQAILELPSGITAGPRIDFDTGARVLVSELVDITAARTASGLPLALRSTPAGTPRARVAAFLDRLGPTRGQLRRIVEWERGALDAMSPRNLRRQLRRRANAAIALRARAFGGHAMVSGVTGARTDVFQSAQILVYSWNPDDAKTDPMHRLQLITTRDDPRPAGEPWTLVAPFRGGPPYPHGGVWTGRCRCEKRIAGS